MTYFKRSGKPAYRDFAKKDIVLHSDGFTYVLINVVGVESKNVFSWLGVGGANRITVRRISERDLQPVPATVAVAPECLDTAVCGHLAFCIHLNTRKEFSPRMFK